MAVGLPVCNMLVSVSSILYLLAFCTFYVERMRQFVALTLTYVLQVSDLYVISNAYEGARSYDMARISRFRPYARRRSGFPFLYQQVQVPRIYDDVGIHQQDMCVIVLQLTE